MKPDTEAHDYLAEPINPIDQAARDIIRETDDPEVRRLAASIRTMERRRIERGSAEPAASVHVVATNHDGDPHPRVEGVYRDGDDAEQGKKEALDGLGAIAAAVYESEVR